MPALLDRAFDIAQDVKAFLSGKRSERQEFKRVQSKIQSKKRDLRIKRQELHNKKEEYKRIRDESHAVKEPAERTEHEKRKRTLQEEISHLRRELRAAQKRAEDSSGGQTAPRAAGEPKTGVLPDFIIIGAKKCGTTSLYYLLARHPHVEPAARKELHYFDVLFDEGVEWYRRCFPAPKWKDGRRTITGEGTPYLTHPLAPERMAQVTPQARLIALLRNPVDRAYSDYQQVVRKGREGRTFEEAIGLEDRVGLNHDSQYLSRGIYVDHLQRWSRFFAKEQMLVLKSEDFFGRPAETLKVVLEFLELPDWEPEASKFGEIRNEGKHKQEMNLETRRRLEEYFEPHNRRLYDYLGVDFGW